MEAAGPAQCGDTDPWLPELRDLVAGSDFQCQWQGWLEDTRDHLRYDKRGPQTGSSQVVTGAWRHRNQVSPARHFPAVRPGTWSAAHLISPSATREVRQQPHMGNSDFSVRSGGASGCSLTCHLPFSHSGPCSCRQECDLVPLSRAGQCLGSARHP